MAQGELYTKTEADKEFVRQALMAGSTIRQIAEALNISPTTVQRYYRFEIMTAREKLKGLAVRVLEDSLNDGSLDAAKFVLARIAGWREPNNLPTTGVAGGNAIQANAPLDLTKLSDKQIENLIEIMNASNSAPIEGEALPVPLLVSDNT